MDIRGLRSNLQELSSMLMRMMQQEKHLKDSNAAWLSRSLKEYDAQEQMAKRLQDYGLNTDIALAVAKLVIKGSEGMDRPGLESISRLGEAGIGDVPGVSLFQPKVKREEEIVPTIISVQNAVRQFLPESLDKQMAVTNLMMTKGSDEALDQMKDYTKIAEAEKERGLKKEGQRLTGRGLDLRAGELAYKKTGTEKVDKTITKIESLRKERSALLDKMSPTATNSWFGNTTKSEKGFLKHAFSLNRDIKRYKGTVKGYDDPDKIYADFAERLKKGGTTGKFIMKILMGKELSPREIRAKEKLTVYLDDLGLRLPILMEYF